MSRGVVGKVSSLGMFVVCSVVNCSGGLVRDGEPGGKGAAGGPDVFVVLPTSLRCEDDGGKGRGSLAFVSTSVVSCLALSLSVLSSQLAPFLLARALAMCFLIRFLSAPG